MNKLKFILILSIFSNVALAALTQDEEEKLKKLASFFGSVKFSVAQLESVEKTL